MRKSIYDEPIDRLLSELATKNPGTDDFNKLLDQIDHLARLQDIEKSKRVKTDTIWIVAGNVVGILIIVAYEHGHVVASRGLTFIMKPKPN